MIPDQMNKKKKDFPDAKIYAIVKIISNVKEKRWKS